MNSQEESFDSDLEDNEDDKKWLYIIALIKI